MLVIDVNIINLTEELMSTNNDTKEYNIQVTFRHTEPTEALKNYAKEKITHCLKKYINGEADAQIILAVEKRDQIAEVRLRSKNHEVDSKAVTADLYAAIDKVIDTVEGQLRKQKEKLRSHKHITQPEV